MNPKKRIQKAMDMEEPDRVPVMCQMSIGHMVLQTKFSPAELWFSVDCYAEALLMLRKLYGFDGILISLHGHSQDWKKDVVRIYTGEREEVVYWKNGDRTLFPRDDLPRHITGVKLIEPEISQFNPESMPEEIDFIPVSQGLEFHFDPEHKYDIFDIIKKGAGARYSIHGEVTSPLDYFINLFGLYKAMLDLAIEPSKSKQILERFTEGVKKIAVEQTERGVDAIKISSPYAGAGFISSAFYREFVLPYESQIARAVRERGVHVYTHTCGAISDRLEMMVESGISGLECLDPPPLGDVRLEEAKKRVGNKVFIKGNIDPVNTLLMGKLEDVEKDAMQRVDAGKPGGGFILSTACSIAPHTKREHVQVLARVAEERGYY